MSCATMGRSLYTKELECDNMQAIWDILRRLPLCIAVHWCIFYIMLTFPACMDMPLRRVHMLKSVLLLVASVPIALFGAFVGFHVIVEVSIMSAILALFEYLLLRF